MPIDPLGYYRLQAFRQNVNQGVNTALGNEALQRKKDEQEARRAEIMRRVSAYQSLPMTTDRNEIYKRSTDTMMGLLPYGDEGLKAAGLVNQSVANYAKLNPVQKPANPPKRPTAWVAVETPPSPDVQLTKQFGSEIRPLEQLVYTDTNEPTNPQKPWHRWGSGGATHTGSGAGEQRTVIDLQKQKDQYNQAHSSVNTYEKRYGKPTLEEWKGLLDKEQPNLLSIASDPNLPDAEKSQQLVAALGTVSDPTLRSKLQIAANYATSLAKREAYRTNITDRGYDVDETGKLVKAGTAKPAQATKPTQKQVSLKAAREQYGDTAKEWSDDELKKFLTSQGYNVSD